MALEDQLQLQAGEIVVTQTTSSLGITDTTPGMIWGLVVAVCDLCTLIHVNQKVLFDPAKATSTFKISTVIYWIIQETGSSIVEEPIL